MIRAVAHLAFERPITQSLWNIGGFRIPYLDQWNQDEFSARVRSGIEQGEVDTSVAFVGRQSHKRWEEAASHKTNDACGEALAELLKAPLWEDINAEFPIGTFVDLGPGTGEKVAAFASYAVEQLHLPPSVVLVDINRSLLHLSAKRLADLRARVGDGLRAVALRSEFRHVERVLLMPDIKKIVDNNTRAAVLVLGQTFTNFSPEVAIGFVRENMRVRDIAVIGMEMFKTIEGKKAPEEIFAKYREEEYREVFEEAARAIGAGSRKSRPDIFYIPDQDDCMARYRICTWFEDRKVQIGLTSRYVEFQLHKLMKAKGLYHLGSIQAPSNRFYKYLVFERVL